MSILPLNQGGTGADLSTTGGLGQVVKQSSSGANLSVAAIAAADLPTSGTWPFAGTLSGKPTFSGQPNFTDSLIMPGIATIVLSGSGDPYGGLIQNAINGTGGPGLPASGGLIDARASGVASVPQGLIDPGSKQVQILLGPWSYTLTQMTIRTGLQVIGANNNTTIINTSLATASQTIPALFIGPAINQPVAACVLFQDLSINGCVGGPVIPGAFSIPVTPNYLDCFHLDGSLATQYPNGCLINAVWNRVSVGGFGGVNWKFLGARTSGHNGDHQFLSFYDCGSYTNVGPGAGAADGSGLVLTAAANASGGNTVYTGTINENTGISITGVSVSGGYMVCTATGNVSTGISPFFLQSAANNGLYGLQFTLSGFSHSANNGRFYVLSSSYNSGSNTSTITLSNTTAVTDTTGTALQTYVGYRFIVSGFANVANNSASQPTGTFTCTASTSTTITLNNASGVSETHAATALGVPMGPSYVCNGANNQHFWYNGQFNAFGANTLIDNTNANCPLVYIGNTGNVGQGGNPYIGGFHGITVQGRPIGMVFDGATDWVVRKAHFEQNFTSFVVSYGAGISGLSFAPSGGTASYNNGLQFVECSFNGNCGIHVGTGSVLQVQTASAYSVTLRDSVYNGGSGAHPDNWIVGNAGQQGITLFNNIDTQTAIGHALDTWLSGGIGMNTFTPMVVASFNSGTLNAAVGSTVLYTVPTGQDGLYRISLELQTITGSGSGTMSAGYTYVKNRTGAGSFTVLTGNIQLSTANYESSASTTSWLAGGTTISYQTNLGGAMGGATFALSARLEYLG
jgi:hypothetical protein